MSLSNIIPKVDISNSFIYQKFYILDYIFFSLNVKAGKWKICRHIKENGPCADGGKHCRFTASGGQAKELGGQFPPSLYVNRGSACVIGSFSFWNLVTVFSVVFRCDHLNALVIVQLALLVLTLFSYVSSKISIPVVPFA